MEGEVGVWDRWLSPWQLLYVQVGGTRDRAGAPQGKEARSATLHPPPDTI